MTAKDLRIEPIPGDAARRLVRRLHYSGKCCSNSQLHLGAFWRGALRGAMQFGPPLDKRKVLGLVKGTPWYGMLELNRMAFGPELPRNSESRALAVAMRMIRRAYPNIQWILSFADGTQCGDGTIYRASGFILTQIARNKTLLRLPDGSIVADKTLNDPKHALQGRNARWWLRNGAEALPGFQMRYIYFLDPSARERLTCPEIPYSAIEEAGAGMYLGEARGKQAMTGDPLAQRQGSTDLRAPEMIHA